MSAFELDSNGRPVPAQVLGAVAEADTGPVNIAELEATMVRVHAPSQAAPQPERMPAAPPVRPAKAPTARDMVRDLRARLRAVNAEIRKRTSLEKERDQLQRLLAAATAKPAPVRAIRSTG